jgi:GNAT superfamily N-acetyltransferase
MGIEIRHESAATLEEYARIPIAFDVSEVFDVAAEGSNRFTLTARPLTHSYSKDYDAIGDGPVEWPQRFDVSNWAFFAAFANGQRIAGAIVAYRTANMDMLEGRDDLAALWDIRVAPPARRRGVGAALFGAAATWASGAGCRHLKVETQNNNVAACRFYAQQGCVLRAAHWGVYPELPGEVQLLWYKDLAHDGTAGFYPHRADTPRVSVQP